MCCLCFVVACWLQPVGLILFFCCLNALFAVCCLLFVGVRLLVGLCVCVLFIEFRSL